MTVFLLIFLILGLLFGASKLGLNPVEDFKGNARIATALTFVLTGTSHFVMPDKFMELMPPFVPVPLLMIYISGFFEILGGFGLLLSTTKRPAAFGLILLLLAVFPANIYVAANNVQLGGLMSDAFYQWLRLPLQFVLIWWVWWVVRPSQPAMN